MIYPEAQAERSSRRTATYQSYASASKLAEDNRMVLIRHSDVHYHLWVTLASGQRWLYNLYPGNCRIYADRQHYGPFLNIPKPWTIDDVIRAARAKRAEKESGRA